MTDAPFIPRGLTDAELIAVAARVPELEAEIERLRAELDQASACWDDDIAVISELRARLAAAPDLTERWAKAEASSRHLSAVLSHYMGWFGDECSCDEDPCPLTEPWDPPREAVERLLAAVPSTGDDDTLTITLSREDAEWLAGCQGVVSVSSACRAALAAAPSTGTDGGGE